MELEASENCEGIEYKEETRYDRRRNLGAFKDDECCRFGFIFAALWSRFAGLGGSFVGCLIAVLLNYVADFQYVLGGFGACFWFLFGAEMVLQTVNYAAAIPVGFPADLMHFLAVFEAEMSADFTRVL